MTQKSSQALDALQSLGVSLKDASDPFWRLNNLYYIVQDDGTRVPFRMREIQVEFMRSLWHRNVILKSRQHGFTTLIDLLLLDQCVFVPDTAGGIIAQTLPDAKKIFRTKVEFPWKQLPEVIRAANPLMKDAAGEWVWANNSSLSVDTTYRGGTLQFLHVSEFGKISRTRPDIADEITRGAFEAVPLSGFIFIESTAEGRGGAFYDLTQLAIETRNTSIAHGRSLTPLEWRFHFFPWWRKPSNRLDPADAKRVPIPAAFRDYFAKVEKSVRTTTFDPGFELGVERKAWYVQKHAQPGMGDEGMWQEHPSTEDEPFKVAAAGVIFAHEMGIVRKLGGVGAFKAVPSVPVNTFWDWGLNGYTAIWFHQRVHGVDRFPLYMQDHGKAMNHYAKLIRETGYSIFGKHYFPHDFDTRRPGIEVILTLRQMADAAGITPNEVIARVDDKRTSIDMARSALPTSAFDAEDAAEGLACLDNYSWVWDSRLGVWRNEPRDDEYAHGADAYQQFAMAKDSLRGIGPTQRAPERRAAKRKKVAASWRSR